MKRDKLVKYESIIGRIVIVGGGFAGLNLVKKLSGHTAHEVVLVDRNNYHFFPPLLYQVSTAFIEASNISYLRDFLKDFWPGWYGYSFILFPLPAFAINLNWLSIGSGALLQTIPL